MSLAAWIDRWHDDPSVGIHFEGTSITFASFAQRIEAASTSLRRLGVEHGSRVAFCGLNRIELFETLFACARIGAIFVPLNNRLTVSELATQITDCDPTVLVATDGFEGALGVAAGGRDVFDVDGMDWAELGANEAAIGGGVPPRAAGDSPLLMVYTSGTTGSPKGAMLSHDAVLHTALNAIDHQDLTAADRVIAPLPTFHVGGLNIQTLPTLGVGGEVVLMRRFEPGAFLDLVTEHRPTQTLLVPAMLSAVASHERFATTDLSCLVGVQTGSSVVPESVMEPYFARGVPVGQVYGATETGPTAVVLRYDEVAQFDPSDERRRSCGRPARHTEVRIVSDDGVDVAPGVDGEIWVRGPNLFSGYWKNPAATTEAFVDGWYRTGDIAHRDRDGYLFVSDRVRDVVISGGENIYPAELEPVLAAHRSIAEVAVIGRVDDRWGEIPLAAVVLRPNETLSIEELRQFCEGRLARFKWPRALVLVDALPRTALGKVQKHVLRDRLG